jgi:hypothetical protein
MWLVCNKRIQPRRVFLSLLVALTALMTQYAMAATWDTELDNGHRVSVDLTTNRAVIASDKAPARPLWDGVHRLKDGSTITIRSGVIVPNEAIQTFQPSSPSAPPEQDAAPVTEAPRPARSSDRQRCEELVLRCCGLHDSCADSEACALARQLRQLRRQPGGVPDDHASWAEQQCWDALLDAGAFRACDQEPPLEEIACRALRERVCSEKPRCADSRACRRARGLFDMERAALAQGADAELEVIRPRCLQILIRQLVFPPCR